MKTLLTFGITVLMSLACLASPSRSDPLEFEPWQGPTGVLAALSYLCNDQMNSLPGVSCILSLDDWTMDLILPVGNIELMRLGNIVGIFCRVGVVLGREPSITVNRMRRACGGIEV